MGLFALLDRSRYVLGNQFPVTVEICSRFPRKPVSQHYSDLFSVSQETSFPNTIDLFSVTRMYFPRPVRPESEASACRARRNGLQSTGASCAADFSNSSSLIFLVRFLVREAGEV